MNKQTFRDLFLLTCKYTGVFAAARHATKGRLRILCYHGVSAADEHKWRPALYMDAAQFSRRMAYLEKAKYPVLTLDEAVEKRAKGMLPAGATVITFDDGFRDFQDVALPIIQSHDFASTLYVTTYHAIKGTPIFRLALSYMFWKSDKVDLDLRYIELLPTKLCQRFLATEPKLEQRIVRHAEVNLREEQRNELLPILASVLGVDFAEMQNNKLFEIVDTEDMAQMQRDGVDIELHTHRHRFPDDAQSAAKEIRDNRAILEPTTGPARHFCYPSGIWSRCHPAILRSMGVKTATTCDEGLNGPAANPYTLKRFLDGSQVSQIRFEAEMCGLMDLMRDAKKLIAAVKAKKGIHTIYLHPAAWGHRHD